MGLGYTQKATIAVGNSNIHERIHTLPDSIFRHTGYEYTCFDTPEGFLLTPTFRNMPYVNSFVPQILVTISANGTQQLLQLTARPIQSIRILHGLWCAGAAVFEILGMLIVLFFEAEVVFGIVPAVMLLFGYLLCKLGTKYTFFPILSGIEEAFSQQDHRGHRACKN